MKFPPIHSISRRVAVLATAALNLEIYPGLTYVLAVRGNLTGSSWTAVTMLRDPETGAVVAGTEKALENFDVTKECVVVTSGDVIRITRTHASGEEAPALTLSIINVALSSQA